MSKLLRYYTAGQVYFVTSVTDCRASILIDHFDSFWESIETTRKRVRFEIVAWVVLPDHFHMIIDPKDGNLSTLMRRVKLSFAFRFRKSRGRYRGTVWQSRFWDHIIRDEEDMNRHADYIHYNPVKHGLARSPFKWRYSSPARYREDGYYAIDWGANEAIRFEERFGE